MAPVWCFSAAKPSTSTTTRWLRWLDLPVFDEEGHCTEVRSIGHDITAHKEAELRLRQLALAVEQSPNTIVITDTEGRRFYAMWIDPPSQ